MSVRSPGKNGLRVNSYLRESAIFLAEAFLSPVLRYSRSIPEQKTLPVPLSMSTLLSSYLALVKAAINSSNT